ncbi:MAG: response regulator, partial [Rhodocyclaceae bacterium]|nr:response regulator [Rhodocyclaceae bacterium]
MLGRAVARGLADAGFVVDWVRDGDGASTAVLAGTYDAAILDLGLPGRDGLQVLAEIRSHERGLPVIIVTARDAIGERIGGLNAGADDYLVKPFDLGELVARIHALVRRCARSASSVLAVGPVVVDPQQRMATVYGQPVALSPREYSILETLARWRGGIVSRDRLEESVYGWQDSICSNAIEVHLHNLRRKVGASVVENVRG